MDNKILMYDSSYGDEEVQAVISVLKNKSKMSGSLTGTFEESFRKYINGSHAIAVSSATAALHLSVMMTGLHPNDEIITTPNTFVSTSNCILYEKCRPVFADIDPYTWNIDPEEVKKNITPKTKALIVVHYAGLPVDFTKIKQICEENNLVLIEDAAHAVGAYFKGQHAGTFGEFGCFSFVSSKNLSAEGGGMLIVKDADIAEKLRLKRGNGLHKFTLKEQNSKRIIEDYPDDMITLGYNYTMGDLQAAIGLEQLKKFNKMHERRATIYTYYQKRFHEENLFEYIQIQKSQEESIHAYRIFPILLKKGNRHKFREYLDKNNIQTTIHYPPIPVYSFYKNLGYTIDKYPNAKCFGERTVTLPLHPNLSFDDVDYITTTMKDFFKNEDK